MNANKLGILVVLSLSIAAVTSGTATMSLVSPVFAGGDHHDHGDKKCKDNDNNNCNDSHKTQKIKAKNECEIENKNKHSDNNDNLNTLPCVNLAANVKDVLVALGLADGLGAALGATNETQ